MQEKPILFSAPMVRAILEGRKTQTRRVVKPQPPLDCYDWCGWVIGTFVDSDLGKAVWCNNGKDIALSSKYHHVRCPYGQVGDCLWVRETWTIHENDKGRDIPCYKADAPNPDLYGPWCPSIHMPHWVSRITLEITEIRVERLQDIAETDAAAEGIEWDITDMAMVARDYSQKDAWFQSWDDSKPNYITENRIATASYRTLWDSINAKRGYSWASNPWVWAISFMVTNQSSERTA